MSNERNGRNPHNAEEPDRPTNDQPDSSSHTDESRQEAQPSTDADLRLQEARKHLRPRDCEALVALIVRPELSIADIADQIAMGHSNLNMRAQHVYDVLDAENRLHLYALYHEAVERCSYLQDYIANLR